MNRVPQVVQDLSLIRRAKGISQEELAQRMGTSGAAISCMENGKHEPRVSTIDRYAQALEVKVYLYVETDEVARAVRALEEDGALV